MTITRQTVWVALLGSGLMLAACSNPTDSSASAAADPPASPGPASANADPPAAHPATASVAPTWSSHPTTVQTVFKPPRESGIPDDHFGKLVRKGRAIFTHTAKNAPKYAGNNLNCSNCHLNAGRRADSAPLWAAWVRYPRYRGKNHKVNSYAERLQGCFQFSMNGKPPPADGEVIKALSAYSYWLATGAPTGQDLEGFGYPKQGYKPPKEPDYARGKKVFASHCALCHGDDGQGRKVAGQKSYVFPPLWGSDSFNWGAGMHSVKTAAAFIKANMPFSRGGTLSDQQAWDVAMYMDSHERPQDPRFTGDLAETRKKYHDSQWSLYGRTVNGHLLGSGAKSSRQ